MSLALQRSDAQEAEPKALLTAQQDSSSPQYHKWLTPDQFASRFGMSDADIEQAESWLRQQGFTVNRVARSKNRIMFSGTVGQAERAFGTELHYYKIGGQTYYAPQEDLSVPVALAPVVQTITNLSSFRPRPHLKLRSPQSTPGQSLLPANPVTTS